MSAMLKVLLLGCFVLAFLGQSCGFTPGRRRAEGEACTRSTDCELDLMCRGGICRIEEADGGPPSDASAGASDADVRDAALLDADAPDATSIDGG